MLLGANFSTDPKHENVVAGANRLADDRLRKSGAIQDSKSSP